MLLQTFLGQFLILRKNQITIIHNNLDQNLCHIYIKTRTMDNESSDHSKLLYI